MRLRQQTVDPFPPRRVVRGIRPGRGGADACRRHFGRYGGVEPIKHPLFEGCRARIGNLRQETRIQPERDDRDAGKHRRAKRLADPLAETQRPLHGRKYSSADEDGDGKGGRGPGGISGKQQAGFQISPLQGRTRQHKPEDWSGAGRP